MKKITFLVAFFLAAVTGSYAQVGSYGFTQSLGTYTEITGGTVLGTTANDDERFVTPVTPAGGTITTGIGFPIGFNFTYNGIVFDRVAINSNGWISLGQSALTPSVNNSSSPYIPISATSTATPTLLRNRIATFAADLEGQIGSEIRIQTVGTTPNQTLVVQWKGYKRYDVDGTGQNLNFQVRLNETTNTVDLVYGLMTFNAVSSTIQVGLGGTVNTEFNNRSTTTNWNTTTAGTANTSTCTILNTVTVPVSGTTFTFSIPIPCTGMPVGGTVAPALLAVCPTAAVAPLVASGFSTGVTGLSFQWEQSIDNFATAGVDAVGGTGSITTTYTPPVFGGTTIYYRMRITCAGSGMIAYSSVSTITPPTSPATQVSTLASVPTLVTAPLTFIAGNGGRRVVYFSDSATFTDPVDGNGPALVTNAVYAGTGQQIVYDGTGTTVTVTGLISGTTYYAKVYEYLRCGAGPYDFYYNVTTGTNILTVVTASPPANDNFANAEAISCGSSYNGNTTNASIDETITPATQFGVDLDSRNVWYKFTGTGLAQTVTLNLCTSAYDSSVLVLTGTSGALTAVAGNDDDASCGIGFTNRSKVSFNSDGTTTYYIAVEGWEAGNFGAYTMAVSCVAVTPPAVANQTCALALAVTVDGSDTNSDNSFGDVSATQPSCDTFGVIQDVWFSFVAPTSGEVTCLVTPTTMSSANFNVYSGACGTLVAVAGTCNANLTAATPEAMTGLVAGDTYFVQVWSNAAEQGTFKINMSDTTLATTSFDKANFTSYPNPVQDVLNISYRTNISSVSVFNLVGQEVLVKTINASEAKVDMSNLSNGTYLVKVTADGLVKTMKVVKQ